MNPLRNLNLKGFIKFAFALLTIFFVSCGGDDYTPVIGGDKDNTTDNNGGGNNTGGGNEGGGSNNTGGETVGPNANANVATADKAVLRLEFPALRKTGKQQVIVYRVNDNTTFDADKVNFSVEWDCDKKSQRWSCYQMHKGYAGGLQPCNYKRKQVSAGSTGCSRRQIRGPVLEIGLRPRTHLS